MALPANWNPLRFIGNILANVRYARVTGFVPAFTERAIILGCLFHVLVNPRYVSANGPVFTIANRVIGIPALGNQGNILPNQPHVAPNGNNNLQHLQVNNVQGVVNDLDLIIQQIDIDMGNINQLVVFL